jgi:nucleotide-binding universal stress UspA family protein
MPKKISVGVDGSEIAHIAFLCASYLRKPEDKLAVFHISSPDKDYLPYDLQPSYIAENYDNLLISSIPKDRRSITITEKKKGQSTKGAVCEYINNAEEKTDFLVVGCAGRKGPKSDPTILGSTTDYSLRSAHCSSIIVKKKMEKFATSEKRTKAKFMACVDGSDNSHKAYTEACRIAHDADDLIILHIYSAEQQDNNNDGTTKSDDIRKKYGDLGRGEVKIVDKEGGSTIAQQILNVATEEEVDFVVVGADGMSAYLNGMPQLGSVSGKLLLFLQISLNSFCLTNYTPYIFVL